MREKYCSSWKFTIVYDQAAERAAVAWPTILKPKTKGGLSIINLRLQNDALLLKHLHKFYSKEDVPWVGLIWNKYYTNKSPHTAREIGSFWWNDILRLSTLCRGIARCSLGDGSPPSSGMIYGQIESFHKIFHIYFHSPRTPKFLSNIFWHNLSWTLSFICHFHARLISSRLSPIPSRGLYPRPNRGCSTVL